MALASDLNLTPEIGERHVAAFEELARGASSESFKAICLFLLQNVEKERLQLFNRELIHSPVYRELARVINPGEQEKDLLCTLYGSNPTAVKFINDMFEARRGVPPVAEGHGQATHLVVACHKRDLVSLIRATDVPLTVARDGNHYKLSVVAEITKKKEPNK
jgi:hypothetical protein